MNRAKKIFVFLLLVIKLAFFLFPKTAMAHATPIIYQPEAAEILEKAPGQVSIHFSERIEQGASGIKVFGPKGAIVNDGNAVVDSQNPRLYKINISDRGEGTYVVSWQVVSKDDGHFTKGAYSYSVGKETAGQIANQIQIQHITTIPQAATIGIELIGQAILLGVFAMLAFLWRPLQRQFKKEVKLYKNSIEHKFTRLIIIGTFCVVIGALSFINIKTFDLQMLRTGNFLFTNRAFLGTVDGSWALARTAIAGLLLTSFLTMRNAIFQSNNLTKREMFLFLLIFAVLFARARVSHAAASHFYPHFSVIVNAIHLGFKELWIGGLVVTSTIFVPLFFRTRNLPQLSFVLSSLSKIIAIAIGAAGVSGVYIVWLHLKDPLYLFSTEWGARFIILSAFGGIFLTMRLYHHLLVDGLAYTITRNSMSSIKRHLVSWLPVTISLEMFVGLMLLFVTGFIIITTPPYVSKKYTFAKAVESQGANIALSIHQYEPTNFLITVEDAKKQSPIPLSDIVVTLTNKEAGIGPIVANTKQRFEGGYVLSRELFTPYGNWNIDISARRRGAYDAVTSFAINYPYDINQTRVDPDNYSIGIFEISMLIICLLIIVLAIFLHRFSQKINPNMTMAKASTLTLKAKFAALPFPLSQVASMFVSVVIAFAVWTAYGQFVKTDFQKLCEHNGHFFIQSVPV